MYAITELRTAVSATVDSKEASRKAGEGLWAWYVRAMAWENAPTTENEVDARHTLVKDELERVRPLSKDERNSLAAGKSVVRAAVSNGKDLWRKDDTGAVVKSDDGHPMPRGKSDLQNDKGAFDILMQKLNAAEKHVQGDKWETPDDEQRNIIAQKVASILASCGIK